jgi:hypothetical protein
MTSGTDTKKLSPNADIAVAELLPSPRNMMNPKGFEKLARLSQRN